MIWKMGVWAKGTKQQNGQHIFVQLEDCLKTFSRISLQLCQMHKYAHIICIEVIYSSYNWQLRKRNGLLVNLCIEAGAPAGPGVTCTATGIASWNPCLVCLKSEEECMTSGWASRMITNREWKLLFPHDPTWNLGPAISVSIISKSGTKKLARWNIGSPCAHLIFFTGRKSLLFTRMVAIEQFPLTSPCYHGKRHNMTYRSFQGLDLVNTLDELHEIQAVGGSKLL